MAKIQNITGRVFGKLLVLHGGLPTMAIVQCVCGVVKEVFKSNLLRGLTQSCGSVVCREAKTHGQTNTKTYHVYVAMIQRCHNPNNCNYYKYGARGIRVCARWRKGFEFFFADMGHSPDGLQLERMNNEKGYCPSNCRWASPQEQSRNTRRNVKVTINGKTKVLADWAAENGINRSTAYKRINRSGWTPKRAVTEAVHA